MTGDKHPVTDPGRCALGKEKRMRQGVISGTDRLGAGDGFLVNAVDDIVSKEQSSKGLIGRKGKIRRMGGDAVEAGLETIRTDMEKIRCVLQMNPSSRVGNEQKTSINR
jgi:hypothetical protein